jgi:6-phospho-beta-glucosidase
MALGKGDKKSILTITDVAIKAGVSISTVSRVLNESAYVDPQKAERVKAAIQNLGFTPQAAARTLAGKKTHVIGLLIPEISGDFFVPLLRGIEASASDAGYELVIQTTRYRSARQWPHTLGEHNTDGLLLFADSANKQTLEKLASVGFPTVLLYFEALDLGIPSVTLQNEKGAFEAVAHMIEIHDRKRIVYLAGPEGVHDAEARFRGYHSALEARGIPFDPGLIAPGDFSATTAARSIRAMLAAGVKFDAVFAGDDGAASGVLAALAEAGIEAGGDVSVIGFDDLAFAINTIPPLATVRAPTEALGTSAVRLLMELIAGKVQAESLVLPTTFVPRASCGCAGKPRKEGKMKLTVIGGGSTYTPELVSGFLKLKSSLPLSELCLMDIDAARLAIVGGFAKRMVEAAGSPFSVVLTEDRSKALRGASYVVNQIRVGKMAARRSDEYLGLRHGLVGQETTGIGGMANALRTIPVALDIAQDMSSLCPSALLLNFANPAGLVTEALCRYAPDTKIVGVCNVGITTTMRLLELWERMSGERVDFSRAYLDTLGLNHLTWHRGFKIDGRDVWTKLFPAILEAAKKGETTEWDAGTLEILGMVPNYYLHYYYLTSHMLAQQKSWPPSRAEVVMEIEKELLALYANPALVEPPPELMKRGGAYYSELATQVVDDHWNDRGGIHVVNVRNEGAVSEWPSDWVLELPATVDAKGIRPLPAPPLVGAPVGLLTAVKNYEILTVEAAVHGDKEALREALLAHPLGPESDRIGTVADDILETNRNFLPLFFL